MARIRSSKPEWWRKPKWCALPRDVRFTYKGIWEVMCDDYGRFLADARLIKGDVWPFDDDITVKKVEAWLAILTTISVTSDAGERTAAVVLYEADGVRYGYLPGFVKHQKISHKTASKFPDPSASFRNNSGAFPESVRKNSPTSGAERDLDREKDLESGAEARAEDLDPIVRDEDRAAPPAPLVVLPTDAERFLEQLYSLSTEKRRLDVRRQLYDTLSPLSRGARLRKGVHVKARSPEHLAMCCRAVLEDPPRNVDASIVILLEKLQDAPPGPSASEKHAAAESERIAEEYEYQRAARSAGIAWAKAHPDEYTPIVAALDAEFPDAAGNAFMRMARESALVQRCARAAEFPDFDTWRAERRPAGAA